jgi:DNA-binding transcriptional ArsR family regulator
MPTEKAALITHPIRARILTALLGRELTTQQIGELLPDVPLSSIYRHVRLLAESGILQPAGELRVNGALTRVYTVGKEQARVSPADTRGATRAEHFSYLTTFLNTLSELYRAYLEQEDADPSVDPVHALMGALYLSPEEYQEFTRALREFLAPWSEKTSGGDRRRILFAHLSIPDRPDPPLSGAG